MCNRALGLQWSTVGTKINNGRSEACSQRLAVSTRERCGEVSGKNIQCDGDDSCVRMDGNCS